MRIHYSFILSVIASATLKNVEPRDGTDPVANVCSPLCSDDATLAEEEDCGKLLGCSELDVDEDPDIVLACLAPCFVAAEECFSLCAERFDEILQVCYYDCSDKENTIDCIAVCFNASFLDFRQGLSSNGNSSEDMNSKKHPDVDRSQTTTSGRTTTSEGFPIEESETIDIVMPDADLDIERIFDPYGVMQDSKFNPNNTHKMELSVYNNTSNVDTFDSNNAMKIYIFLSKLFPDLFEKEWRAFKKLLTSNSNNEMLRNIQSNQHQKTTDYHFPDVNSPTPKSVTSSDQGATESTLSNVTTPLDPRHLLRNKLNAFHKQGTQTKH